SVDGDAYRYRPEGGVFPLMRRVFSYARPHRRILFWLIFHVVLRAILLPFGAWSMGAVVNGPIASGDSVGMVWATAGFTLLIVFTNWMFRYRYRLALALGEAVIHDLRSEVFRHILSMPMSYFTRSKVGAILGRVTSDIDSVRTGVQDVVFVSAVQLGQMLVAGALMLYHDWGLFVVVLGIAPGIWLLNRIFTVRIAEAQRRATESFSRISATLSESVSGVRVTQGFVREEVNALQFRELVSDQARYNLVSARTSAVFLPLLEFKTHVFTALLLAVGGWQVLRTGGGTALGDVVQFAFLATLFFEPVRNVGTQYAAALSAMVGAERVFRLLDTVPEWRDPPKAVDLPREEAGIRVEFKNVWFAYEVGNPVLRGVSFSASPGMMIALVGHTGSGKTSITNLISKFYLASSGEVLLDGREVRELRSDSLRRQMGVVHQQSFLFEGSVLENIRFGRPEASDFEVEQVVDRLGFRDLVESLPEGFQTLVGESGARLSSGERQLVNFARALLVKPRLLILDEATSAVDSRTEMRIQSALRELLRDRTSFVVAHRLSTIRNADLILVLHEGEIVERGTHETLMSLGGRYAALHRKFTRC
ncbi:MAG: putative multidrug resistance transporter ATP-binding/permease protein YheH, partial [Verrucomicrobiota bacterium]